MNTATSAAVSRQPLSQQERILFFLLFLFFSGMVFREIPQAPFYYDSAIHIDASKHIAYGLGNSINPYTFELFSTQTSGLLLTSFGAIVTQLVGAHTWTPGLAAGLLSLAVFAILLVRLPRTVDEMPLAVAIGLCWIFLLQDIMSWVFFVGENSSMLLFLTSALLAADNSLDERRRHLLVGLAASLALRARLMAIPMIGGVACYLLIRQLILIHQGKSTWKDCTTLFLLSLSVFAAVSIFFESIEYSFFLAAGSDAHRDFLQSRMGFLAGNNTVGIGNLLNSPDMIGQIVDNVLHNYTMLATAMSRNLGLGEPLPLLLAAPLLALAAIIRQQRRTDRLLAIILLAFALNSTWFFLLARITFERYTQQEIFLLLLLLLLSLYRFFSWQGAAGFVVIIVLAMPDNARTRITDTLIFQIKKNETIVLAKNYNRSMDDTVAFLATLSPDRQLAKCGWMTAVWSIDYLMPPGEHFADCYRLIRQSLAFDEDFYLAQHPETRQALQNGQYRSAEEAFLQSNRPEDAIRYYWKQPVNFILVIDKITWRFAKANSLVRPAHKILMQACKDDTLFENNYFRVMDCKAEKLQAMIPLDHYNFFVDQTPYWKR